MSADFWLLRYFNPHPPTVLNIGLALSVIAGICCLWRLPISLKKRALLTIVFVPVSVAVLLYYSLWLEQVVFGDGI
jgi:hypothetical protein